MANNPACVNGDPTEFYTTVLICLLIDFVNILNSVSLKKKGKEGEKVYLIGRKHSLQFLVSQVTKLFVCVFRSKVTCRKMYNYNHFPLVMNLMERHVLANSSGLLQICRVKHLILELTRLIILDISFHVISVGLDTYTQQINVAV